MVKKNVTRYVLRNINIVKSSAVIIFESKQLTSISGLTKHNLFSSFCKQVEMMRNEIENKIQQNKSLEQQVIVRSTITAIKRFRLFIVDIDSLSKPGVDPERHGGGEVSPSTPL